MLSEYERKVLNEIEREISRDDPDGTASFVEAFDRSPLRWPFTAVIIIGGVLTVVGIFLQLTGTTLIALVLTLGAVGGRRLIGKRRDEDDP